MSEATEVTNLLVEGDVSAPVAAKPSRVSTVLKGALVLSLAGLAVYSGNGAMKKANKVNSHTESMTSLAQTASNEKVCYGCMTDDERALLWDQFKTEHRRDFTEEEDTYRQAMFLKNLREIDNLNGANPYAVYTITDRADWTPEERAVVRGLGPNTVDKTIDGMTRYQYLKSQFPNQEALAKGEQGIGKVMAALNDDTMQTDQVGWLDVEDCAACKMFPEFSKYNWEELPENFDWRALGAVSSVKNQKYCGSCWSFSTAGDLEGTHYLSTGSLHSLAEQQLVACDPVNSGCNGGMPFLAMQYLSKMGGMVHEEAYPYKGICAWGACGSAAPGTPTCDKDLINTQIEAHNVSSISAYQLVALGAEYERYLRLGLVKNGPISIAFNAAGMDYYAHGIVGCPADDADCEAGAISHPYPCDPDDIDHAVLLVGYGVQNDVPYWVIKNSWASAWGEDGYYRLVRGVNKCGVANFAVHSVRKPIEA